MKNITQSLKVIALALALSIGISYVSAWTAPTGTPPGGNTSAPINVSGNTQYKSGALGVGGVAVFDSQVGVGRTPVTYQLEVAGDVLASNGWLRTTGDSGWYSDTWGGGWRMTDTSWIRAYGDKGVYTPGEIQAGVIRGNSNVCIGSDCRSSWPAATASGSLVLRSGSSCNAGETAVLGYANPNWVTCTGGGSACSTTTSYNCNSMTYAGWGSCSSHPNKCGNGSNLNLAGNVSYSTCSDVPTCWDDGTFDTGNWYNCASNSATKVICQTP